MTKKKLNARIEELCVECLELRQRLHKLQSENAKLRCECDAAREREKKVEEAAEEEMDELRQKILERTELLIETQEKLLKAKKWGVREDG